MAKDAAPKDLKSGKRKASTADHIAEKPKKAKKVVADASEASVKKRKATEDAAPVKVKKSKTPTANLTTDDGLVPSQTKKEKTTKEAETSDQPSEKKEKKAAKAAKASDKPVKEASNGVSVPVVSKTDKSGLKKKQKASKEKVHASTESKQTEHKDDEEVGEDSEDEIDDQTEALLKGFESDRDEELDEVEGGYEAGAKIPSITDNKELSKKRQAKLQKAADFPGQGKPGVVYVGRVPHGFYENEMKAYFGQFGTILNLRLSRNPKTGKSKHYAFIQFENSGVAEIVAKTMDNYLMFGHILKVKLIPEEQVPANVWKGANKRFKKVPWNKIEGRKLEQGASEEAWEKRIEREQKRREKKAEKMKAIGYELEAPAIKSAKGVSKKGKPVPELADKESETAAVSTAEEGTKTIEAASGTDSSKPKKKNKKSKAAKDGEPVAGLEEAGKSEKEEPSVDIRPAKEDVEESVAALIAETAEKPSKKAKKDKKKKAKVVAE